jgi:hypothetical protein
MTWDEHYRLWSEVRRQPGQDAHWRLMAARKRVAANTPDDWLWLTEALADPDRKWFVAAVFKFQPVPKRLFGPMLRAGVLERNPYPEELRPLIAAAVEVARSHSDEYIRHRVEVQLGSGGPFMPIPDTRKHHAQRVL